MALKKRPKARAEDGLSGLSDQTIARYREIANYGDLIDEYFRMVHESLNSDEPIEATTDDFLRYARVRRHREGKASSSAPPAPKERPQQRGKAAD
jgi:hypothetical protein